jgi:predicted site-specific integrase-resolvase
MERIVAIGEAADVLGVSIATLRRWEAAGKKEAGTEPRQSASRSLAYLRVGFGERRAKPWKVV